MASTHIENQVTSLVQLALLRMVERNWTNAETLLKQAESIDPFSDRIQRLIYFCKEGMGDTSGDNALLRTKFDSSPWLTDALGFSSPIDTLLESGEWQPATMINYQKMGVEAAVDIVAIHEFQAAAGIYTLPQLASLSISEKGNRPFELASTPLLTRKKYSIQKVLLLRSILCGEVILVANRYFSAVHTPAKHASKVISNDKTGLMIGQYVKPLVEAVVGARLEIVGARWVHLVSGSAPPASTGLQSKGGRSVSVAHTLVVTIDWTPAGSAQSVSACLAVLQGVLKVGLGNAKERPLAITGLKRGDGLLRQGQILPATLASALVSEGTTCTFMMLYFGR